MVGGYFVPNPNRISKASSQDKTVQRIVLIVPSRPNPRYEELCRELECHGVRASVDIGAGAISLDGINRVLVIIPRDNEKRWAEIRQLLWEKRIQVTYASINLAVMQLLKDLEL